MNHWSYRGNNVKYTVFFEDFGWYYYSIPPRMLINSHIILLSTSFAFDWCVVNDIFVVTNEHPSFTTNIIAVVLPIETLYAIVTFSIVLKYYSAQIKVITAYSLFSFLLTANLLTTTSLA